MNNKGSNGGMVTSGGCSVICKIGSVFRVGIRDRGKGRWRWTEERTWDWWCDDFGGGESNGSDNPDSGVSYGSSDSSS